MTHYLPFSKQSNPEGKRSPHLQDGSVTTWLGQLMAVPLPNLTSDLAAIGKCNASWSYFQRTALLLHHTLWIIRARGLVFVPFLHITLMALTITRTNRATTVESLCLYELRPQLVALTFSSAVQWCVVSRLNHSRTFVEQNWVWLVSSFFVNAAQNLRREGIYFLECCVVAGVPNKKGFPDSSVWRCKDTTNVLRVGSYSSERGGVVRGWAGYDKPQNLYSCTTTSVCVRVARNDSGVYSRGRACLYA